MIKQSLSFVAVVQAGSYSAAAKKSGVSKAQLSRHIIQLEESLGIALLYRTTRVLSLTHSGEAYFKSCLAIQEDYNDAVDNLKQTFNSIKGTLRITAPIAFGSEKLTLLFQAFSKLYPNIKLIVSFSSFSENLITDNYDLAIRIASRLPDSDLKVRKLLSFKTLLCASPEFINEQKMTGSIDDLETLPCITSVNRTHNLNLVWPFFVKGELKNLKINSVIEIDGQRSQILLAKTGMGIVRVFNSFVEDEIKRGELIEVYTAFSQPEMHAYLLYPNRKRLPKKIELFKAFLLSNLESR